MGGMSRYSSYCWSISLTWCKCDVYVYLDIDVPVFRRYWSHQSSGEWFHICHPGMNLRGPLTCQVQLAGFAIVFNLGLQKKSLLGSEDVGVTDKRILQYFYFLQRLSISISILARALSTWACPDILAFSMVSSLKLSFKIGLGLHLVLLCVQAGLLLPLLAKQWSCYSKWTGF